MSHEAFGGALLASSVVGSVRLTERLYASGTRMHAHRHDNAYFCIVRAGGFREQGVAGATEHRIGDIIFHAPGDEHANAFLESGARCFNVELNDGLIHGLSLPDGRDVLSGQGFDRIFRRLYREFTHPAPSRLIVEGLVYQALGEAFQHHRRRTGTAWLDRVRETVDTRYASRVSVVDLARMAAVHPTHLSRAFHHRFGVPLRTYVGLVRVCAAQALLAEGALSLSDVAAATGFADQSHFTRAFKASTGRTPGAYRRGRGRPPTRP